MVARLVQAARPDKGGGPMLWALLSRPLSAFLTIAGVSLLAPVLLPLTAALIKPLVKPVTNLYLDIAEEMGEIVEERHKRKASEAIKEKKALQKETREQDAREIKTGSEILSKLL
jgi:hypothetical protein